MTSTEKEPFESGTGFFSWALEVLQQDGKLTSAEVRVCEQLMLGRRYSDVAKIESISEETVRWHAKRILKKLHAETTREFILVIGRAIDERIQNQPEGPVEPSVTTESRE